MKITQILKLNESDAFKDTKVGDKVKLDFVHYSKAEPRGDDHEVVKVTPTEIHVKDSVTKEVGKYHRSSGRGIGNQSASYDKISPKKIKESLVTEAKDYFPDVDVIKLDPDRADTYDIVQALMPTLVRTAYVHLSHDKDKYERTHTEEDDEPFEFTNDALEERLDTLIDAIRNRLDDQSSHDKHAAIEKIKSEFKEKLTEAVETPANLMPQASGKKNKI